MTSNSNFSPFSSHDQYTIRFLNKTCSFSGAAAFWVIILVAISLRLLSAFYQGNTVTYLPGIFDQISYDGLARRVAGGYGFSFDVDYWPATRAGEPTAHWSFIYTLYLAAIYKIFGIYPLIARVIQALVTGVFQTIFIWRIGTRLFNRTVGLVAAAISAIYIYFFYYAGALITETFYITAILWVFDSAFILVAAARNPEKEKPGMAWRQWLVFGLALGVTVLLRQVFLLFLPFLFLWLWLNIQERETTRWKRNLHWNAIKGLSAATLVLVLMVIPFTIRNYRAFGTFVLLNTNAGFAFYWGNHPIQGTNFQPLLDESYQGLIPLELLPLNEGKLDRALLQEGIKIVINDPVRFFWLSVSRIEEYVKFWPSQESSLTSNISRVGSFGIFLPFMIYGLWISVSGFRKPGYQGQRYDLLLVYIFIVVYASVHFLSWTLIRYRLPIDGLTVVFAALGIENLLWKTRLLEGHHASHV